MDATAIAALFELGPYGVAGLAVWWAISKDKKIDEIRAQQILDTKIALEAVAKSTDRIADAEERQHAQTEATKELVAMVRVIINKGQV